MFHSRVWLSFSQVSSASATSSWACQKLSAWEPVQRSAADGRSTLGNSCTPSNGTTAHRSSSASCLKSYPTQGYSHRLGSVSMWVLNWQRRCSFVFVLESFFLWVWNIHFLLSFFFFSIYLLHNECYIQKMFLAFRSLVKRNLYNFTTSPCSSGFALRLSVIEICGFARILCIRTTTMTTKW